MAKQLTDFECQVIILFKEHPTWKLTKCAEILPKFSHQLSPVFNVYLTSF